MMISGPRNRHYDSAYILGPEIFDMRLFLAPEIVKLYSITPCFANATLNDMVNNSGMKDRISICKLNLNCHGDEVGARYRDGWTGKFDGVHMYSSLVKDVFTRSLLEIFKSILPRPHNRGTHSSSSPPPSTHFRSQFQKKQKTKMFSQNNQQYENIYSVPVRNQFETLGN